MIPNGNRCATLGIDPNYWMKLVEWDFTEELLPGRRPSNPETCTHLWSGTMRLDLPLENIQLRLGQPIDTGKPISVKKST